MCNFINTFVIIQLIMFSKIIFRDFTVVQKKHMLVQTGVLKLYNYFI